MPNISDPTVNYFAMEKVGERYARSRPVYQPNAVRQIRDRLGPSQPVRRALDVGCGTGNSSRALAAIAREVIGIDASRGMLGSAERAPALSYVESLAESLPFVDESFDLVTVASAFHWFDRSRFLPEVHRVLVPEGWLAVYTTGFTGGMRENPGYAEWNRAYRARYPSPPRHHRSFEDEDAEAAGLAIVAREKLKYAIVLTVEEIADYLTTQSNVIAAVERGPDSLANIRAWLIAELQPLFRGSTGTFPFEGTITYARRAELDEAVSRL
jgi:SAM-dependent methyltransferase